MISWKDGLSGRNNTQILHKPRASWRGETLRRMLALVHRVLETDGRHTVLSRHVYGCGNAQLLGKLKLDTVRRF